MFRVFDAATADELWQQVAAAFRDGEGVTQGSRIGPTQEIMHAALCIRDPRQRWIMSRRPAMSPAFAVAEVVWIVTGRQDSAFLNYFNPGLPRHAGDGKTRRRRQRGLSRALP